MAKLLHLSRPSRRVSQIVRTWLAMRRQKRRRQRSAGEVVLPQITLSLVEVREADQVTWSPVLDVGIEGEMLPEGFVVKVWQQLNESGPFAYRRVGAAGASRVVCGRVWAADGKHGAVSGAGGQRG